MKHVEEDLTAILLFPFDQEVEVHGGLAARFDRSEETENLALVVGRAAGEEVAVPDGRLERRRGPLVEGIRRLHVVVTVEEQRRRARNLRPDAPDHGMNVAAQQLHVPGSETAQFGGHPLSGAAAIGVVRGKGGD